MGMFVTLLSQCAGRISAEGCGHGADFYVNHLYMGQVLLLGRPIPKEPAAPSAAFPDIPAVVSIEKFQIPEDILSLVYPAVRGGAASVRVGQWAILIGNALGEGQNASFGIVSVVNCECGSAV